VKPAIWLPYSAGRPISLEVSCCGGAEVKSHGAGVGELVTHIEPVLVLGDVHLDLLGPWLVRLHLGGDLCVDGLELLELAGLGGP
jgi:hypothetical protein